MIITDFGIGALQIAVVLSIYSVFLWGFWMITELIRNTKHTRASA